MKNNTINPTNPIGKFANTPANPIHTTIPIIIVTTLLTFIFLF